MIQTNLREIDMADIDAKRYADDLKSMNATVALINTAGIIASYPTKLPYHFQSPFLRGDSLARIIEGCHDGGIRVIARTDFSKVRRPLYEQHPEWACVYPGGVVEDYNGDIHCCINGEYQQVYSHEIIKEALSTLDVDGIFFNMGGFITRNYSHRYLGICQCENCRTLFFDFAGMDLPQKENMDSPVYRKYRVFQRKVLADHKRKTVNTIKAVRPDIAINHNTIDGAGFLRQESNTEFDRPLPRWQYSGSANTKWAVTSWPEVVSSNATVDFIGFYYRHVAVSPALQELRLWQGLANCGGLDYYLIGRLDNHRDRSGLEGVKRVFAFHADHYADCYRGLRPDSDVLLVSGGGSETEYRGWYRMLSEGHFLFDVVVLERLAAVDLERYCAVVLPDTKYIDDEASSLLDSYVENGGTVVASGESGLFDEEYEQRWSCSLQSLGIRAVQAVRTDLRSALFEVNDKSVFPGMVERDLVYFGDTYVFAEYVDDCKHYLRYIPPHNYGPPERCYWEQETDLPGVSACPYGRGKGIHLPWLPGKLFYREGHDNTPVLVWDLLERLCGISRVAGNLPPMVEVTRSTARDESYALIQLVNGTGHFGTSFFRPVALRDISLRVAVKNMPKKAECLNGGQVTFDSPASDGTVVLRLDSLGFFEAIKLAY
jgi:hypothetical protein